jgi:Mg-chelatase subunit ChlI
MKRALILNAINFRIGGVLIRGERGTAKSTAARALAALLPGLEVITGCSFGCDPDQPSAWCTHCRQTYDGIREQGDVEPRLAEFVEGPSEPQSSSAVDHKRSGGLPTESQGQRDVPPRTRKRVPFVDLPVGATEDRVVGTLDIERAIQKGERHFEPGVLASANRGILYVDEVNLLDDHIVDVLLDAAAMGVNVVEREGISFQHPARFILVGTMNPEEGDLRPQLLDRFALCVDVVGVGDAEARIAIMARNLAFEQDPDSFYEEWRPREEMLAQRIAEARRLLPDVRYTRADLAAIATMMSNMGVDGHRADMVILKTARAHAAWEGRSYLNDRDIILAAELALPHRLKRKPFDEVQYSLDELGALISDARQEARPSDEQSESQEVLSAPDDATQEEPAQKKGMTLR